jgi:hypothetical protein
MDDYRQQSVYCGGVLVGLGLGLGVGVLKEKEKEMMFFIMCDGRPGWDGW